MAFVLDESVDSVVKQGETLPTSLLDSFFDEQNNYWSTKTLYLRQVTEATKFSKHPVLLRITMDPINPLRPSIKFQILLLCFHTFLTEVLGRSC